MPDANERVLTVDWSFLGLGCLVEHRPGYSTAARFPGVTVLHDYEYTAVLFAVVAADILC